MATLHSLMDFLRKFEGNNCSIHRKFAQKDAKWISNTCLYTGLVVMMSVVQDDVHID